MATYIKAGARIRNVGVRDYSNDADSYEGTLGCLVRARSNPPDLFVLTAGHVLNLNGYGSPGQTVQAWDGQQWVKIAEFERATILRDAPDSTHICDACIARVTASSLLSPEIQGLGYPTDKAGLVWADMGLRLNGATSGPVSARVYTPPVDVDLDYSNVEENTLARLRFLQQIRFGSDDGARQQSVTHPGDSGALVIDVYNTVVGLHIASTPQRDASVCTPIQVVLDYFNVDLVLTPIDARGSALLRVPPMPGAAAPTASASVMTTDPDIVGQRAFAGFGALTRPLLAPHNPFGGVTWALCAQGVVVDGRLERTGGAPTTVSRVWSTFGAEMCAAAIEFKVPVELIVATICTESSGKIDAIRIEPGWKSDIATPNKVSVGLMQTLISSAREALAVGNKVIPSAIDRNALLSADMSIRAGAAYIRNQRQITSYDPPLVACGYNAGRVEYESGLANRWKMRQFPIGTGMHADRFVQWFNDCFACLNEKPALVQPGVPSFWGLFRS